MQGLLETVPTIKRSLPILLGRTVRGRLGRLLHPDDVLMFHTATAKQELSDAKRRYEDEIQRSRLRLPSVEVISRAAAALRNAPRGRLADDKYSFEYDGCKYAITINDGFALSSTCPQTVVWLNETYNGIDMPLWKKRAKQWGLDGQHGRTFTDMAADGNKAFAKYLDRVLETHSEYSLPRRHQEVTAQLKGLEVSATVDSRSLYSYPDFLYASTAALSYGDIVPGSTTVRLTVLVQRFLEIVVLVFAVSAVTSDKTL